MKKKVALDEIDLIGTLLTIWQGKFKIILITLFAITLILGYSTYKKKIITATTMIKKISIFEENSYKSFNSVISALDKNEQKLNDSGNSYKSLNSILTALVKNQQELNDSENLSSFRFDKIDGEKLLELFIEKINDRQILIDAIDKFELIDKQKFQNEELYFDEVEKLAFKLKLLSPENVDKQETKRDQAKKSWSIRFQTLDKNKWIEILEYLDNEINKQIKNELIVNFNIEKKTLKILNNFKIQDINKKIINEKKNYEIETKKRLSFLNEQALMARELDIKNNTLEVQNFSSQSSIISSVQIEKPYYMNGYIMIEKEIELINSRSDSDHMNYIDNLVILENEKRTLLENNNMNRIELLFLDTPIFKSNNFKAANINVQSTKFENTTSLMKELLLAIIIGLLIGVFYVLVNNAIQQRK